MSKKWTLSSMTSRSKGVATASKKMILGGFFDTDQAYGCTHRVTCHQSCGGNFQTWVTCSTGPSLIF